MKMANSVPRLNLTKVTNKAHSHVIQNASNTNGYSSPRCSSRLYKASAPSSPRKHNSFIDTPTQASLARRGVRRHSLDGVRNNSSSKTSSSSSSSTTSSSLSKKSSSLTSSSSSSPASSSSSSSSYPSETPLSARTASSVTEPKSILKHTPFRRMTLAFGELPRSAEYEHIMTTLLSARISDDDSVSSGEAEISKKDKSGLRSDDDDDDEEDDDDGVDGLISGDTNYRACFESCSYQLTTTDGNVKDDGLVKKVTFNDEVFCAPDS